MLDGMESERMSVGQLNVGSAIASVCLSGADLLIASAKIDATELADSSVGYTEIGSSAVRTANLNSGCVAQLNLGSSVVGAANQCFLGYGSPLTYGMRIEAGSSAMTSATSLWVILSANFSKPPYIIDADNSAAGAVGIAAVAPGSFLASGTNGTIFHWAAIGPA